jgi:DNA-binding response OmpR family regulator
MPDFPAPSPAAPAGRAATAERCILLLEDERELAVMLREHLESLFYRVTWVEHGADGLRALMTRDYDVIICDMVMPTMPGDMFFYAVQRLKPHLCARFIFITAHRGNPKVNDFLSQMSSRVLHKPFHLDDLLDAILESLRLREKEVRRPAARPG